MTPNGAAKRPCVDSAAADSTSAGIPYVTSTDLKEQLGTMSQDLAKSISATVIQATTTSTGELVNNLDQKFTGRLNNLETTVNKVVDSNQKLEKRLDKLESKQDELNATIGRCTSIEATSHELELEDWTRTPNPAISSLEWTTPFQSLASWMLSPRGSKCPAWP